MSHSPVPDLSAVASPPQQSLSYKDLEIAEEALGVGGQAVVYEATLNGYDQPSKVALKEPIHEETLSNEGSEAFLQEASMWQTIDRREREKPRWSDYEHIVGIVDTGESHVPWIAMEYMDGGDLEDRLASAPEGLPIDEALWIGECLCRGLEIAGAYGYSHLDVKPKNILFRQTSEENWNVPKLADWGVARTLGEQTGTMEVKTITYSAPEQFEPSEFGDPDSLTDLYQVGAVVYAMLTGEPPYTGSKTKIMREVVMGEEPPTPSQHRPELSTAIDVAVEKALAKHKQDRYRGVREFEKALRAIRTGSRLPVDLSSQIESTDSEEQAVLSTEQDRHSVSAGDKERAVPDNQRSQKPWPMFHGDANRTGYQPHFPAPTSPVTREKHFEAGDGIRSSPAVADGTVFVGSDDSKLYAVDATTGEEHWHYETSGAIRSSPAVVNDTVYFGSNDYRLYAVDAPTGEKLWHFETDGWIRSSPVVADDTVFIGSDDHTLYALEAATGKELWRLNTMGLIRASPTVANGTVFVGSQDTNLYAVDTTSGEQLWHFPTEGRIRSSPAVVDGTVIIGSFDSNLYAVDANNGNEIWTLDIKDQIRSSPAVANGTVFIGSDDSKLRAVDITTGKELWQFEAEDWIRSSPVVADGTVLVGSNDTTLYAVHTATGEERWHIDTYGWIRSSPAVTDGTVFLGCNDSTLYAISEK